MIDYILLSQHGREYKNLTLTSKNHRLVSLLLIALKSDNRNTAADTMSKIVLYEERGCRGKWKEFTDSDSNLETESFAKTARSLKVEGKHWVAYKGKDMKGDFMVYGPGEHTNLCWMDRQIMSLRLVKEELGNPEIVLYEDAAFRGQSRSIDGVVDDLRRSGFNDLVSAHEVKQGVWILYEYFNQTGRRMITFKGEKCGNYCLFNWNDRLSSLRPLLKSDHEV